VGVAADGAEGVRLGEAFGDIVACAPVMRARLLLAARAATSDITVLLTGESGTGKDVVARAIHAASPRRRCPFVALNCAAIPDALVESELFGYCRGAFTGASTDKPGLVDTACGGTLFLDEIGDLPLALQAKLLRLLQERVYLPLGARRSRTADVRVIAATNAGLRRRIEAGAFRADLYYRLAAFPIHLPPLRERAEDLRPLAERFLSLYAARSGRADVAFGADALAALASRAWPGNVRELEHTIARAVIVARGPEVRPEDLASPDEVHDPSAGVAGSSAMPWRLPPEGVDLPAVVRRLVGEALVRTGGNLSAAARLLRLSRAALRYRVRKYRLTSGSSHPTGGASGPS
jgi:transcriptional regulator with PAS, ATPase and Fis domain